MKLNEFISQLITIANRKGMDTQIYYENINGNKHNPRITDHEEYLIIGMEGKSK